MLLLSLKRDVIQGIFFILLQLKPFFKVTIQG
jgi:hypothetical protein